MTIRRLLLLSFCLFFSLCSCSPEQSQDFTISHYDSESRIEINLGEPSTPASSESSGEDNSEEISGSDSSTNTSDDSQTPGGEITGTLLVKDKKYTFEGNDLVIVDVTNETNQNLSITINIKYLDASGKVLKEESQNFNQSSAGYQNYFLFRPEINFSDFSYTVDANITSATCYAKDIQCHFYGLMEYEFPDVDENGKAKRVPSLLAKTNYTYLGKTEVLAHIYYVLFNSNGEIVAIFEKGPILNYKPDPDGYDQTVVYFFDSEDWSWNWPDHLEGELTTIAVLTNVTTEIPD